MTDLKKKDEDYEEEHELVDVEECGDFDINPIKKTCKYCNVEVTTYVEHEIHPLFFFAAFALLVVFGFLSFVLIPLTYLLTKTAVHRCSRCLQVLGQKQCFGVPTNLKDQIWTFRFGKCSVVISRLIAMIIFCSILAVCAYYLYIRPFGTNFEPVKEGTEIKGTWTEYITDCGGETIVENQVHAKMLFEKQWQSNIVTWTGFFSQTKPPQNRNVGFGFFESDHAFNILVKMSPSESSIYADLVLSVSTSLMKKEQEMLDNLKSGDEIKFKAEMRTMGNEFEMHHLHAIEIEKTGEFKNIDDIIVKESSLP